MTAMTYFRVRSGKWFILPSILICWNDDVFQIEPSWMNIGIGIIFYDKRTSRT